jgi:hypothetical protein
MATKKSPAKKSSKPKAAAAAKASSVGASKLTWALAVTFMVLSLVFMVQAFYYYA